ncbi:MAG: hypothetical protein KBA86_00215 [Bacteroidales bacterium]|nr:hypothetical protein [Bacteroidales bacterium]
MKTRKNKAILFSCGFFGILGFITLSSKFLNIFKMGPSSWEEIGQYLPLSIICSLVFAAWVTWGGVGDSLIKFFANRRKNKKKDNNGK